MLRVERKSSMRCYNLVSLLCPNFVSKNVRLKIQSLNELKTTSASQVSSLKKYTICHTVEFNNIFYDVSF